MASSMLILCPRCTRIKPKTTHHIYPREFFGQQPNGPFLFLCEGCHRELQKIVHYSTLDKSQILHLTYEWLYEPA